MHGTWWHHAHCHFRESQCLSASEAAQTAETMVLKPTPTWVMILVSGSVVLTCCFFHMGHTGFRHSVDKRLSTPWRGLGLVNDACGMDTAERHIKGECWNTKARQVGLRGGVAFKGRPPLRTDIDAMLFLQGIRHDGWWMELASMALWNTSTLRQAARRYGLLSKRMLFGGENMEPLPCNLTPAAGQRWQEVDVSSPSFSPRPLSLLASSPAVQHSVAFITIRLFSSWIGLLFLLF